MSTARDDSGGGDASLSQASLLHQQEQESDATTTGVRVVYVSPERRERFEFRRLLSIACGILGCCSIGATYSVGILSNGMQRVFGLSQDSITTIVFVGFLTAYLAFPAGWVMDVYGPKAVMIIATTLSVLGWALFALDFAGMLADGSVAFLAFICALFFWTPGFFDPATMLTNLFMFPLNRGTIVLVQKTFMSLASTVVSLTFNGFFQVAANSTANASAAAASNRSDGGGAEGLGSAQATAMVEYCATFAVIGLVWGLSALAGVREAPQQTLRRLQRNNAKEEAAATAAAAGRMASPAAEDEDASRVGEGDVLVPAAAADSTPQMTTSDGLFLCCARELSDAETQQQRGRGRWCTDEEWSAEPRIEIALIEALPMPTPVSRAAFVVLGLNFVFLSATTLVAVYVDLSHSARVACAVVANALVFGFFLLPLLSRFVWPPTRGVRVVVGSRQQGASQAPEQPAADAVAETAVEETSSGADEVVMPNPYAEPFRNRILTLDCWLFWCAMAGISSTGGTLVGNAFQMFNALADGQLASSAPVLNIGLIGIGGAAGRMLIGAVEQFYLTPRRYCSTILMPVPSFVALVGLVVMPLAPPAMLWLPFFLVAAAYGMSWAALLLNARQLFTVDVAQNYLFIFSAGLLSVPLSRAALGPWYDAEAERQGAAPGKCLGVACVSLPIAIMAAACLLGTALSCVFHVRWSRRNGLGPFDVVPRK